MRRPQCSRAAVRILNENKEKFRVSKAHYYIKSKNEESGDFFI